MSGRWRSAIRLGLVMIIALPLLTACATPATATIGMPLLLIIAAVGALAKAVSRLARHAYAMTWRDLGRAIVNGLVAAVNAVHNIPAHLRPVTARIPLRSTRDWLSFGAKGVHYALAAIVVVPLVIVVYLVLLAIALFIEIPIFWPSVFIYFFAGRMVRDRVVQRAFARVVGALDLALPSRTDTDLQAMDDVETSFAHLERDLSAFLLTMERTDSSGLVKGQR